MNTPSHATLIIMSSAFVGDEVGAEYGRLPPALLPLGSKRLVQSQIQNHGQNKRVILTLPEEFTLRQWDQRVLASLNVDILPIKSNTSLMKAMKIAAQTAKESRDLEFLFGDTLLDYHTPLSLDAIAVMRKPVAYQWTAVKSTHGNTEFYRTNKGSDPVLCGHIRLSDPTLLLEHEHKTLEEFLTAYHETVGLRLQTPETWHDVGHLATLFQARQKQMVARVFNDINVEGDIVHKTSNNLEKMNAEANWYTTIPKPITLHTPRFIERTSSGYKIEYLNMPTVSDLFCMGNLSDSAWAPIWDSSLALLSKFHKATHPNFTPTGKYRQECLERFYDDVLVDKSTQRAQTFLNQRPKDFFPASYNGQPVPEYETIIDTLLKAIPKGSQVDFGLVHGDLFFANMLYDSRARKIFCIDPKGIDEANPGHLFGDRRYDLAKISHSAIGLYDFAIAEQVPVDVQNENWNQTTAHLKKEKEQGNSFFNTLITKTQASRQDILAMTSLLFFTMLPLHHESLHRQRMLYGLGLRLFLKLGKEKS